jgi:2-polyprenyl-6-methoxyphenol hydroxylase-like FAD-dependent oxidoreductase
MVDESEYAELRLGCEGLSIEEVGETVQMDYRSCDGSRRQVLSRFLVGADGKRGFVRKGYLEAKGIRQVVGV